MSDESEIKIKLKSFDIGDYFNVIFMIFIILGPIGFMFFFRGIWLIITAPYSIYYPIGIVFGGFMLFVIFRLIATITKNVTFLEDDFEVSFLDKKITIPYSQIEWVKFAHPPKSGPDIAVRLKKRRHQIKVITITLKNDKKIILGALNHLRNKDVPTGLTEIGEQFFKFNPEEGKYEMKKDKRIDISKLW